MQIWGVTPIKKNWAIGGQSVTLGKERRWNSRMDGQEKTVSIDESTLALFLTN
jgi:hypothetical protein